MKAYDKFSSFICSLEIISVSFIFRNNSQQIRSGKWTVDPVIEWSCGHVFSVGRACQNETMNNDVTDHLNRLISCPIRLIFSCFPRHSRLPPPPPLPFSLSRSLPPFPHLYLCLFVSIAVHYLTAFHFLPNSQASLKWQICHRLYRLSRSHTEYSINFHWSFFSASTIERIGKKRRNSFAVFGNFFFNSNHQENPPNDDEHKVNSIKYFFYIIN